MRARGREIYIITAVVAVVLIVAWYFLLFSPKQRELSDLDQQVQSAQSALSVAQQEVVKLESYKKTAPQSRAEIVRLGKMLPTSEGVPGLIIELTKTAEASGVTVTSIARGTTTAGSPFGIQTSDPAGQRTLLRRRGLPLPARGVRGVPQRQLPGDRAAPSGAEPDPGGAARPRPAAVRRCWRSRSASMPICGAGRRRLRRLRQLEVRNDSRTGA